MSEYAKHTHAPNLTQNVIKFRIYHDSAESMSKWRTVEVKYILNGPCSFTNETRMLSDVTNQLIAVLIVTVFTDYKENSESIYFIENEHFGDIA